MFHHFRVHNFTTLIIQYRLAFLCDQLLYLNPRACSKIRIIVVDKDFKEIAVLRSKFPHATILLCQFHVSKCFRETLGSEYGLTKDLREVVLGHLTLLTHSATVQEYEHHKTLLSEILLQNGKDEALAYLRDNWFSIEHMWVTAFRNGFAHLGLTTTNHLESFWDKLKDVCDRYSDVLDLINQVVNLTKLVHLKYEIKMWKKELTIHADGAWPEIFKPVSNVVTDFSLQLMKKHFQTFSLDPVYIISSESESHHVSLTGKSGRIYVLTPSEHCCSCNFNTVYLLWCKHLIWYRIIVMKLSAHDAFSLVGIHDRWKCKVGMIK